MTRDDLLAIAAIAVIALAASSTVLAVQARRYAARALLRAHSHPTRTEPPTPRHLAVDRRLDDHGPPPGEPERRRHRAPDELGRARRRDVDDPQWRVSEREQPPVRMSDGRTVQPPEWYDAQREPPTDEHPPPTRDMRRVDPPRRP